MLRPLETHEERITKNKKKRSQAMYQHAKHYLFFMLAGVPVMRTGVDFF